MFQTDGVLTIGRCDDCVFTSDVVMSDAYALSYLVCFLITKSLMRI